MEGHHQNKVRFRRVKGFVSEEAVMSCLSGSQTQTFGIVSNELVMDNYHDKKIAKLTF